MTSAGRQAAAVEQFLRQVDQECADLPDATRDRLIADLRQHLVETASDDSDTSDAIATLGDPTEYAQELRAALNLPPAPFPPIASINSPPTPRWKPTHRRAIVAVAAAVVVVVVLALTLSSNHPPHRRVANSRSASSSTASGLKVIVPSLLGLSRQAAADKLAELGFAVNASQVVSDSVPAGTVIAQRPAANSTANDSSTIDLSISETTAQAHRRTSPPTLRSMQIPVAAYRIPITRTGYYSYTSPPLMLAYKITKAIQSAELSEKILGGTAKIQEGGPPRNGHPRLGIMLALSDPSDPTSPWVIQANFMVESLTGHPSMSFDSAAISGG